MAVEGLFSDRASILKKVRSSDLEITEGVIDTTLQQTRVNIYSSLGATLVATLIALPIVENPTTEDGINKLTAINLEVNLANISLLRRLPIATIEQVDDTRELFNDDPLTRNAYELGKHLDWLEEQVENAIKDLLELEPPIDENNMIPRWGLF